MPVSLDVDVDRRLAESIEFSAYYVVAEALTNAAKYSQASGVTVWMGFEQDGLRSEIANDGVGGATSTGGGSGLVALKDRVEAVSGRLAVSSPIGEGTTLTAWIPQEPDTPKSLSE